MRFVAAALFLVVYVAACGKALPATTPAANPALDGPPGAPRGVPLVFGWDGVDGRMMMTSLVGETAQLDSSTWTFNGTEWVKAPSGMPKPGPGLGQGAIVYDSGRNRELLIGETATWEWDGQSWRATTPHQSIGEPGTSGSFISAAYSPDLHATVVIALEKQHKRPTWLFDGTNWQSVLTANLPPWGPIVYDTERHSIVGLSERDYQTWQFDGLDWTMSMERVGPSPHVPGMAGRFGHATAYDQKRREWVVFGGDDLITTFADTWTGDEVRWTKRSPTTSPPARLGFPFVPWMTWDPSHDRALLFGGRLSKLVNTPWDMVTPHYASFGDTWAWDGNNWTHVAGSTSPAYPTASSARLTSP
jgi:hypothetical protein